MQKRNLPYSALGNWWHFLLAIGNIGRRTRTIPNPHLWWYYWKYDDMTSHVKKQNISNCYPLQNYIFLLWWKPIRNNSHVIQSRDIKGTTERAFSHKLIDNSTRQKQTYVSTSSTSKRKRQQSRNSLFEQKKEAEVTVTMCHACRAESSKVSLSAVWPFLDLLLCWCKKKSTTSSDARMLPPFFL